MNLKFHWQIFKTLTLNINGLLFENLKALFFIQKASGCYPKTNFKFLQCLEIFLAPEKLLKHIVGFPRTQKSAWRFFSAPEKICAHIVGYLEPDKLIVTFISGPSSEYRNNRYFFRAQ